MAQENQSSRLGANSELSLEQHFERTCFVQDFYTKIEEAEQDIKHNRVSDAKLAVADIQHKLSSSKNLQNIIIDILNFYHSIKGKSQIIAVYLYGSWATNRAHKESDINIAIIVEDSSLQDAHFNLFSLGKDWNIDFQVLVLPERDYLSEDPLIIHEIKTKGIRLV